MCLNRLSVSIRGAGNAEGYEPAANGVIIYLNGGDNLQPMLDRAIANGGEVVLPKTQIDEENGYFAMFLDTEGNRIGLHSPHWSLAAGLCT